MFSTRRTAQQRPSQQPPLRPLLSLVQQKFPLFPSQKALCPRQPHQVLAQRPLELEKSSMEILLVLRPLYLGWLFWLLCKALERQMSSTREFKLENRDFIWIFLFLFYFSSLQIISTSHTIHIPRLYDKQIYRPNTSPSSLLYCRFKHSGNFTQYLITTSPLSTATPVLVSSLPISLVLGRHLRFHVCNSNFLDFELFAAQVFESQSLFKAGQSRFQFKIDPKYRVVFCGCCGRRWGFFNFVWGWRHIIWFVQGLKVDLKMVLKMESCWKEEGRIF